MRVSKLEVNHFLGFRKASLEMDPRLQLVAGPNNAGKSSLIRLLDTFFSDPKGGELLPLLPLNAYYRELGPRTLSSIQVWFTELNSEEKETFAPILRRDGHFWLQLRCGRGGEVTYRASRDASAEEAKRLYHEALMRFNFVNIPSVRVAGSPNNDEPDSLARLVETLEAVLVRTGSSRSTALQQEFQSKMEPLEVMVREVLKDSATSIVADMPFQESGISFRLPEPRSALRGMLESAVIESDGDAPVPISKRGTGFQSALVLGILRYVALKESQGGSNLMFAIEEPEAFLHPQTQRAMAKIIKEISSDAQVLVTTHSSVLVDSFDISRIARIPLQIEGSEFAWRTPKLEPTDAGRLSRYCSATNSELIFANAVIFVEGEGDYFVLEKLLSRACSTPGGHYALGITVIEAGGVTKMPVLVQLAELFGVRSYVLADGDAVRNTGSGKREMLSILKMRTTPPTADQVNKIVAESNKRNENLAEALKTQENLNELLNIFDAFVMSSDLEGMFLDAMGVSGIVDALGPAGEGSIDAAFSAELTSSSDGYEKCAKWMGSRGWNSDRKTSGKLEPHLAPYLLDVWLSSSRQHGPVVKPLMEWLGAIVSRARLAPL